jgi:magnesium-transporting ATPase (P-type)
MEATENLAYTNIICTGKTGTITTGELKVRKFFIGGEHSEDFEANKLNILEGD